MRPIKNKRRIDPRYFLDETAQSEKLDEGEMTPEEEEFMYGRFRDTPGYEDESIPGKTAKQSTRSTSEPPLSRGGHSPYHPKAAEYDKQMDDLDQWLQEEEVDESIMDKEVEEGKRMTARDILLHLQDAVGRHGSGLEMAEALRNIADKIEDAEDDYHAKGMEDLGY